MTQKTAENFVQDLLNDAELAGALADALGESTGEDACAAVARFAQARAYALDAEQAKAIREAALQGAGSDGELDDAALESVAGGFMFNIGQTFQPNEQGVIFMGW